MYPPVFFLVFFFLYFYWYICVWSFYVVSIHCCYECQNESWYQYSNVPISLIRSFVDIMAAGGTLCKISKKPFHISNIRASMSFSKFIYIFKLTDCIYASMCSVSILIWIYLNDPGPTAKGPVMHVNCIVFLTLESEIIRSWKYYEYGL